MRIGRTAVVTDTGRRRIGNEDAFVFKPPFFAIADGMGGARAGEIAAGLAAAALEEGPRPSSPPTPGRLSSDTSATLGRTSTGTERSRS